MQAKKPSGRGSCAASREAPFGERGMVDFLAREMEGSWTGCAPSSAELANHAVRGGTFLSISSPSAFLRSVLSGSALTDLGAGDSEGMEGFALVYGVREYVAVDRYHLYPASLERPGFSYVNIDILSHLSRQEDGSSNIVMNAMDECMLRHPNRVIEESYSEMLLREIARVVPPGGIAFGLGSPVLHGLRGYGMERISALEDWHVGSFGALYRKPEGSP